MNWVDYFNYYKGELTWKVPPNKRIRIGSKVGTLTPKGYILITLLGRKYLAHRVIFEMHNGPIPTGMEIDHINGIRNDNRIQNLRLVTSKGNHLNMGKRCDNTSGITGVAYCKRSNKWKAYVSQDSKLIHLGFFDAKEDAISVRKSAESFYGFSERHGL